ncbi:MAG: LPS export ABC transporter periplasmic protein LptC [Bacteroidaceae bacterium]|nr:LPS export ABC transporter periplasmic protein LptC [Bacteroidaceae bacterium]
MEGRLIPIFFVVMLVWLGSCTEQNTHTAPAVHDRDSASMMTSYGVNTLISDSGVIKYRIVTERWDVNTVKNPPRWTFEKGIFMEQFDEQFHIEGYIQADTAWYYDQQKLWELRGRVHIRNLNGLIFRSEELYWDGIKHEFYSHKFSRVITPERTLEGTYFRSDEHMTHYEVSNSEGSFQAADMTGEQEAAPNDQQPAADTAKVEVPVRKAATRHRAMQKTNLQP